jgi:hypothetical protein
MIMIVICGSLLSRSINGSGPLFGPRSPHTFRPL